MTDIGEPKEISHIIGQARTIATAVLVVEYLRSRYRADTVLHSGMFAYRFKEATSLNGFWSADIIVKTYSLSIPDVKLSGELVDTCRAFVAGRGEVWA